MDQSFVTGLVVWYVVFLFSTTLHEAMHSFAASWGGDDTAYRAGSATLNPLPHIEREKVGMILAPLASYFLAGGSWMIGWASAPFNPYWAARYPRRSFLMALAGPLSHLLPLGVAWISMYIGLRNGFFVPNTLFEPVAGSGDAVSRALAIFLNIVFLLNTVLLVFNLIPVPPLDGSEVWYLFVRREEKRLHWRYTANSYSMVGILLAWYVFQRVYYPVLLAIVRPLVSAAQGG